MVDIKVGDWVKLEWWFNFYKVGRVDDRLIYIDFPEEPDLLPYSLDDQYFIKRDNPTPSPVREVVTKELVDGVYGRVRVKQIDSDINPIFIKLLDRRQIPMQEEIGFNAKELRELAKTLNEVAEFLEGE